MVVASVYWLYGFMCKGTVFDQLIDKKRGKWIYKPKLEKLQIITTPHEVRWTDYKGDKLYIGMCETLSFTTYTEPPNLTFDDEFTKTPLEDLFENVPDDIANLTFAGLYPKLKCKYEMIPTDCNCCS